MFLPSLFAALMQQSGLTDCLTSVKAANPTLPTETARYPQKTETHDKQSTAWNLYHLYYSFTGPIKVACSLSCLLLTSEVNKLQAPFLLDCLKEKAPKAKIRGTLHSNYDATNTAEFWETINSEYYFFI